MTTTQRWTLVAAILGSSIVFLDGTVVNLALPRIGEQLPATLISTLEGQTYVASGYLATLAALLVLAGALGDYHGRRRVFAIGLVGFGATSVLCGLAPSLEILALARVLQGAAGALLVPGSLALITAAWDEGGRGRAIGVWAAATSATAILGPPVGGVLVESMSWRVAFLVNAPLVAVALWATLRHVEESRDEEASAGFDWLGAGVAVIAVGGLAFGAIRGQDSQWQDTLAWGALVFGALATIAFPVLMAKRPNPLVPLALFRSRAFAAINLSTLLIYGALYVGSYFQSLFLQGVLGYSALAAAIVSLPAGILLTLLSTRVGGLASRLGARRFLVIGPLVMAAGTLWWVRVPSTSEPWRATLADPASLVPPASVFVDPLPAVIAFGLGITLVVAPLTSTLMGSIPVRNAGIGAAINNAVSRVGYPLLSAVIFIIVSGSFYGALADRVPGVDASSRELRAEIQPLNRPAPGVPADLADAARDASTDAFHLSALVGALLLVAGAGVNHVGLRPGPERVPAGQRTAEPTTAPGMG